MKKVDWWEVLGGSVLFVLGMTLIYLVLAVAPEHW